MTIGPAISSSFAFPYSSRTSARANSSAVPGPLLVTRLPSTITLDADTLQPPVSHVIGKLTWHWKTCHTAKEQFEQDVKVH